MCGLVGLWSTRDLGTREERWSALEAAAAQLRHRGPDDSGAWIDPDQGFGFAHRRLSILDLSPAGHQPMTSADARYVIAFNGEIYNHAELRSALEDGGRPAWRGHSDTEVMLAAFSRWGIRASLEKFVGMFAIALWDREERALYLARDRFGEKPLYYGCVDSVFVFGSELKALRALPGWHGRIDRTALTRYMRHNYVPAPRSIYEGIGKLAPGSLLRLDAPTGEPRIEAFWSISAVYESARERRFDGSANEAVDELERLVKRAISLQMVADVPLGALLSGGIDSSTVVAIMQSLSDRPIRTFTIGFENPSYDEARYAKAVARHLGTQHTELYVQPRDAMDVIPRLAAIYDEPFADSSQIPTYLVAQLARQSVTVSLSGDGGDELFAGYSRYAMTEKLWARLSSVPLGARRLLSRLVHSIPAASLDRLFTACRPLLPGSLRFAQPGDKLHKLAEVIPLESVQAVYARLISHWTDPASVVVRGTEGDELAQLLDSAPSALPPIERMMCMDARSYLPDDILVKVDRAAMAVSLETRVPFLDHRVAEFAAALPLELKLRNGVTKWPLREVLYRYVPREFIERPKMGFGVPIGPWLRDPLRDWAETLLAERRLRSEGFFEPAPIRTMWAEHLAGHRNWAYPLWDVLMFQTWREHAGA